MLAKMFSLAVFSLLVLYDYHTHNFSTIITHPHSGPEDTETALDLTIPASNCKSTMDGTWPKLSQQGSSMYFNRKYWPTEDEAKEMDDIRKDLQICNYGKEESLVRSIPRTNFQCLLLTTYYISNTMFYNVHMIKH